MKTIFITEISGGGVEKVNVCLAKELHEKGYDVKIISLVTKNKKKNDKVQNVDCIFLNKKSKKLSFIDLLKTLEKEKPSLIVTNSLVETYYSEIYKSFFNKSTKIIYVQHSVYSTTFDNNTRNKIRNRLLPKITDIFNRLDGIVFVSKGVKEDFLKCINNCKTENTIIYNPIVKEENNFRYKGIDKKRIRLVTAGRIEKEKNQELIINALEKLITKNYNIDLTIFGKGSKENYLQELCKNKNIIDKVYFEGYVDNLEEKFFNYDIFVLSSNYESFGNVLVEAMNCSLPVISTDCPVGPREILCDGKYGYLTKINDYIDLSEKIEKIILENNENITRQAFERSKDFCVKKSVDNYIAFFEHIVKKN